MEAFVIDWRQGNSGTLFTSVGLVIVYANQDNIDDKIVNGKIYGSLELWQVERLRELLGDTQKMYASQNEDMYVGYLFYDDHVDEIILNSEAVNEIPTLQYQLV